MSDTLPDLRNIESPFNACMHREHCKGWKALAARQQAQAPEGFVLVPVEPTLAMLQAALNASRTNVACGMTRMLTDGCELWAAGQVYSTMLAAAPQAAQPEPSCIYPACHHNGCTEQCKKQPEQAAQQSERERFEAAMLARPGFTTEEEIAAKHSGFYLYHRLGHAEIGWQAARADLLARLEAVPEPRKWNLYGTKHHWVRAGEFDDYRAAMLAAARGER